MRGTGQVAEVRWGDRDRQALSPTLGAVVVESRELVRAEGPAPGTWHVAGNVEGVDPADVAGMAWEVLVEQGIGAFSQRFALPFVPGTPFTLTFVPAQLLVVKIRATGVIAVGGSWVFGAGAAPNVPWTGLQVRGE